MKVTSKRYLHELLFRELNEYMHRAVYINRCYEALILPDITPVNLQKSSWRLHHTENMNRGGSGLPQKDNPYYIMRRKSYRESIWMRGIEFRRS